MTGFDPGPEWREVPRSEAAMHAEVVSYRAPRGESPRVRTWIRAEAEQ